MIRILTDSTCDILPHEAARMQVEVVPLQVTLEDGTTYRDGLDLTPDEFYSYLKTCHKLPITSQPSPEAFLTHFEEAKQAGDEVIAILLSSHISGTYQSAKIASTVADYPNIHLIDGLNASLGNQLLVRLAVSLREQGKTAQEIAAILEHEKHKVRLLAVVDDLKYFRKGGRLNGAEAFAGTILGIKPVVGMKHGTVGIVGKARGMAGGYVTLFKQIDEEGGINFEKEYLVGYTGSRKAADPIIRYLTVNKNLPTPPLFHIGPVIGTHSGPGAAGIAFFAAD